MYFRGRRHHHIAVETLNEDTDRGHSSEQERSDCFQLQKINRSSRFAPVLKVAYLRILSASPQRSLRLRGDGFATDG